MAKQTAAQKAAAAKRAQAAKTKQLTERAQELNDKGEELTDEERDELNTINQELGQARMTGTGDAAEDTSHIPRHITKEQDFQAKLDIHGEELMAFGRETPIHELLQEQREIDAQIKKAQRGR